MKQFLMALLACAFTTSTLFAQVGPPEVPGPDGAEEKPVPLSKEEQEIVAKASQIIGMQVGGEFGSRLERAGMKIGTDINVESFAKGVANALSKTKPDMTDEEMEAVMETFQRQLTLRQMSPEDKQKAIANSKASKEFLAKNAKREGVTTTDSGLQYEVIKNSDGKKPGLRDRVKVHYHGTLIDGTVFDSSIERKEPATFPVGGVIPGWVEALQLMPVGSKWKIYVPSDLAYGLRGPAKIGPDNMLVFEVELLEILANPQFPAFPAPEKPSEDKKE